MVRCGDENMSRSLLPPNVCPLYLVDDKRWIINTLMIRTRCCFDLFTTSVKRWDVVRVLEYNNGW